MISLVSYILVIVGSFNWFSIGVLQFDFIAGIFGSQANIFSRVVYAIIGFAALWLIYATVKQRGKIFVNGKKENDAKLLGKLKDTVTMKKDKDNSNDQQHENYTTNNENSHSENKHQHNASEISSENQQEKRVSENNNIPSSHAKSEYNEEEF